MKEIFTTFFIVFSINFISAQQHVSQEGINKRNEVIKMLGDKSFWKKYNSSGVDNQGNKADFEILILTQDENWRFKDAINVQSGNINFILPKFLNGRIDLLKRSDDIICVGTASLKGTDSVEILRAGKRAENIAKVVKKFILNANFNKNLYTLNLGKFIENSKEKDSASQRPVIIIGTNRNGSNDIDLNIALKDALLKIQNALVINIKDYNKSDEFKLEKYE